MILLYSRISVVTCGIPGVGKTYALSWMSEHGFFPLEIFRAVGRVEASLLAVLRRELYTLFETRALWRHEIAEFYATASIRDRI